MHSSLLSPEPTPPGSISVLEKTNSSLTLVWAAPAQMDDVPDVGYHGAYQKDGSDIQYFNTSVNRIELSSLSSGTLYNITLVTVVQNRNSTAVHHSSYTRESTLLENGHHLFYIISYLLV